MTTETIAPVKMKRKRATKLEMEARRAGEKFIPIPSPTASKDDGCILVPREVSEEVGSESWVKRGDKRSLRELRDGSSGGLKYDIKLRNRYFCGVVRVGAPNEKTGGLTVYSYEHRSAKENEEEFTKYGSVFYWDPIEINGEDVLKLEEAMAIGAYSEQA